MKRLIHSSLVAVGTLLSPFALGAVSKANFNDIATGSLSSKTGGSGFASSWAGSATFNVIAGDLNSSLYWLNQGGTPQSVRAGNNSTPAPLLRQEFRVFSAPYSGELWFSILQKNTIATDRSGLSFNAPTASPFNDPGSAFLYFTDTSIVYRFGDASDQTVSSPVTSGNTGLVVGRMIINGSGAADTVNIWVNPSLPQNATPADLLAITPNISNSTLHFADTLTHVGLIAWKDAVGGSGGIVDNFAISDGGGLTGQGFADVVPEPSGMAVVLLGTVGLLRRRRGRIH